MQKRRLGIYLMTSMLAQELIAELIELHEKKADK